MVKACEVTDGDVEGSRACKVADGRKRVSMFSASTEMRFGDLDFSLSPSIRTSGTGNRASTTRGERITIGASAVADILGADTARFGRLSSPSLPLFLGVAMLKLSAALGVDMS